jgi:hypothetical protein
MRLMDDIRRNAIDLTIARQLFEVIQEIFSDRRSPMACGE